MLEAIRASGGTAIAVSDAEIHEVWGEMSFRTGVLVAPEGAATLAALRHLLDKNLVGRDERVVLFNTGSGIKYLEAWFEAPKGTPA
jgi:threonine synthase